MGYMTNGLTFDALRGANNARLPQFANKHGVLVHSDGHGKDWTPAQWLQAVVGELGEYANLRKKYERGDITEEEFLPEAADELADVVTYLDILAMQLGIDLGRVTMDKFNRVSVRVGSTVRLEADDWHYAKAFHDKSLSASDDSAAQTVVDELRGYNTELRAHNAELLAALRELHRQAGMVPDYDEDLVRARVHAEFVIAKADRTP